jgi:hypothetical protein
VTAGKIGDLINESEVPQLIDELNQP